MKNITNDSSPNSENQRSFSNKGWEDYCQRGTYGVRNRRNSVRKSMKSDGKVYGYYSEFLLDPTIDPKSSMYPSQDHQNGRDDHTAMVTETRLVNDMKSHLSEKEFWQLIKHLYTVGLEKGTIDNSEPYKLSPGWSPKRNF